MLNTVDYISVATSSPLYRPLLSILISRRLIYDLHFDVNNEKHKTNLLLNKFIVSLVKS